MSVSYTLLIGLFIGSDLILAGIIIIRLYLKRLNRCSIKVNGVIKDVDYEEGYDSADRKEFRYFPIIGFYFEGAYYVVKADEPTFDEKKYVDNAEIGIRINPENPEEIMIAQGNKYITIGTILILIGFVIDSILILTCC